MSEFKNNTLKEIAEKLNGRQYLNEITKAEEKALQELGIVVIFGGSDDLCEIRGAIYDEIGCYNGGKLYISKNEVSENPFENAKTIEILWCENKEYSWTYKTDIPHECFDVYEDDEKYCQGIVLNVNSISDTSKRISKKTFIEVINLIKEQEKINEKISEGLGELIDGWAVFKENKALTALLLVLKEELGPIGYDYIEWWLWENVEKKVYYEENGERKEIDLTDVGDLYDYIVSIECD